MHRSAVTLKARFCSGRHELLQDAGLAGLLTAQNATETLCEACSSTSLFSCSPPPPDLVRSCEQEPNEPVAKLLENMLSHSTLIGTSLRCPKILVLRVHFSFTAKPPPALRVNF